jgi:hypothetical protein
MTGPDQRVVTDLKTYRTPTRAGDPTPAHDDRWQGNAAAGFLAAIFAGELCDPTVQCASCGLADSLETTKREESSPNLVVRCRGCDGVLLRLVELPTVTMLDLHGVERVALPAHRWGA